MKKTDPRHWTDEELNSQLRKFRWLTLAGIFLVFLTQAMLIIFEKPNIYLFVIVIPVVPVAIRFNKYLKEYQRRNPDE